MSREGALSRVGTAFALLATGAALAVASRGLGPAAGRAGAPAAPEAGRERVLALPLAARTLVRSAPVDSPAVVEAPAPRLVATARRVDVFAAPRRSSPRIGYLRGGAVVERVGEPQRGGDCAGGFQEIAPRGFVCVGSSATLDPQHPAAALPGAPDRESPLPYQYGLSRFPTPPLYSRVPSYAERAQEEPELHYHVRHQKGDGWRWAATLAPPASLRKGGAAPRFDGQTQQGAPLLSGRAIPGSGFAFASLFSVDGYAYGLSTDLSVLPLDRLKPVRPSTFRGVDLDRETTLPVAFVRSKAALLWRGDPHAGDLLVERRLDHREALPLSGNRARVDGRWLVETTWGDWAAEPDLVVVDPLSRPPSWAEEGRRWIEVSVLQQTLVAYEGTVPRRVTLVSTGKGGLDDARGATTVRGTFLIHSKHVSRHMGRSAGRESYDLRDVPYVQYFHEGYALHATYWHDGFGSPRSHGCINLSPIDAHWLFGWTQPEVPDDWHGAFAPDGTLVYVHP